MRYKIYIIILITIVFQLSIINQANKLYVDNQVPEFTPLPKHKTWVKGDVKQMIKLKAIENNLNPNYLVKLADCESSLNPKVQSKFMQSYGREQSFGLFQIHLKAHKNITVQQALDPVFNTTWAIEQIKKGKAPRYWVHCHKVASSV